MLCVGGAQSFHSPLAPSSLERAARGVGGSCRDAREFLAPSRALVLHPFNPPHLLPVVEVVPGEHTAPAVVDAAVDFLRRAGKTPVVVRREVPGFVVNRIQLALLREAWSLLDGGVASAEDIDALAKLPSLDQLRGQFLGLMQAVPQKLLRVLQAPSRDFVGVLDARRRQQEGE